IVLTTSIAESVSPGRNAIGSNGEEQIKMIASVLHRLPSSVKYIILVMHHPLLWGGLPRFPRFEMSTVLSPFRAWDEFYSSQWFVAVFLHNDVKEAEQIYSLLKDELDRRPGASALVLYGHRHERTLSRIGSMTFEEAPNLATTEPKDYG